MKSAACFPLQIPIVLCLCQPVLAQDIEVPSTGVRPRFEAYSGLAYATSGLANYSTVVWSAAGPVTEHGPRLRIGSLQSVTGVNSSQVFSKAFQLQGVSSASDILAGYQFDYRGIWTKFYAGAKYSTFAKAPHNHHREEWGGKIALETWKRFGGPVWGSADVSWSERQNALSIYTKLAYDIADVTQGLTIACGTEAAAARFGVLNLTRGTRSTGTGDSVSAGGILNARYGTHDLSVSGGYLNSTGSGNWMPYATVSYGRKF